MKLTKENFEDTHYSPDGLGDWRSPYKVVIECDSIKECEELENHILQNQEIARQYEACKDKGIDFCPNREDAEKWRILNETN